MLQTLEPELLQSFVAIAETGSFTEAAKRIHRTQSAVSMQIKRLEDLLGRPVFLRTGRSVSPTPDGELLLGHARRILRAHREAIAAFDGSALEGTVRIGTPDQYASLFLPDILAAFAVEHPRVHVEVVCDISINLKQRLEAETLDLALLTCGHGQESGVIVLDEPLVWAGSARHCVHEQVPVPLALFETGCIYRRCAVDGLTEMGRPYRLAYTSMSLAAIEAALRAGLAVSAIPRFAVRDGLRILGEREGFPPLTNFQVALLKRPHAASPVLDRLEEHVIEAFLGGSAAVAAGPRTGLCGAMPKTAALAGCGEQAAACPPA
ncbi:MAG: LysR family transcriptional regulator [Alphaproteobacteria bacterium]|nr:LysR family transcriptional regulator [Alphaproteobacteria bacterium]